MAEISEREQKERREAKKQRMGRPPSENPKNRDEIKVIFRATVEQKRRLIELAEFYKVTMTDVMLRSIDVAYRQMELRKEAEANASEE